MSSLIKKLLFCEIPTDNPKGRLVSPARYRPNQMLEYGSLTERILSCLGSIDGPQPAKAIAGIVGHKSNSVIHALCKLNEDGLVHIHRNPKHNFYSLSSSGVGYFE